MILNIPGFWIANSPGFWICLWFWMYHRFGNTEFWICLPVLNIPWFWIYHSSEYARVTQGWEYACIILEYAWICLIYVWICVNISEYAWICPNLLEWLLLYIFPFPNCFTVPCLLEHEITYLNVYRRLEVIVWRNMGLFS